MINILFASSISSIFIFVFGIVFYQLFFNSQINNVKFEDCGIFGIIFLSFISLFINFFLPLNKLIGSLIICFALVYFIYFYIKYKNKAEIFFFLLFTTIISFLLITLSTVNRPDAGLYHLPYIGLINESKIILGSSNIHFRFGHISLIQYLSAIFNNYFFKVEFINMPLATAASFYFYFLKKNFFQAVKEKNKNLMLITFLYISFSLYAFNRYSNYGNDAIAHMYFFILSIYFIKINKFNETTKKKFFQIALVSIFLFSLKPFMILSLLFPLIIWLYLKEKKSFIFDKKFIIFLIFLILCLLKNLLSTGCLLYPENLSCIKNLRQFNERSTSNVKLMGELWAKDLPNNSKFKSYEEYNSDFNWVLTWKEHHLKKIIEKLLPYVLFLFLLLLIFIIRSIYFKSGLQKSIIEIPSLIFFLISFVCCIAWFVKFPLYRYGMSYIAVVITLLFQFIFFKFVKLNDIFVFKKLFILILTIGIIGFLGKNSYRIYKNYNSYYTGYPWPKIYTLSYTEKNIPIHLEAIKNSKNEIIYYYSGGIECMYTTSLCSNYKKDNLKKEKIFGYDIYYQIN